MPYLVRWDNNEGNITLRCEAVIKSKLIEDQLTLLGVRGLKDPEHPDLAVHTISLRNTEIGYIIEAIATKPKQETAKADPASSKKIPVDSNKTEEENAPKREEKKKNKSKKSRWT